MKIEKIYDAKCKSGSFVGNCNFQQNKKIFEEIIEQKEKNNFTQTIAIISFPRDNLNSCFLNKMSMSFKIAFQSSDAFFVLTFDCNSIFHDENINHNFLADENEICYTDVELLFSGTSNITIKSIS